MYPIINEFLIRSSYGEVFGKIYVEPANKILEQFGWRVPFYVSWWLYTDNFIKNELLYSYVTEILSNPEQLFSRHLFFHEHLWTVASLATTFLWHTLDKKSLIYNDACSNESCRICFTVALPKFQFITKTFIAINGRSSTSADLRSNLPAVYCHKVLSFWCCRSRRSAY